METVINFVEHGKHHGHILVHCHKGISRSASFVIGYLMKKNEMTLEEAVSHVQSIRPTVLPNNSFMEQLRRYEMLLHEQRETEMTMQQSFDERIRGGAQDRDGTRQKKQRLEVSVGPEMNFHAEIGPAMPAPQESATSSQSKEIGPQSDSDLPLEVANFFS